MRRIDKISKHVRLISMNATIEAAGVGDEGRGFAVIANEIRSLPEDIALTTGSIHCGLGHLLSEVRR